jgi:DUF4097 and DUF4098 domain-containing protein YvlB
VLHGRRAGPIPQFFMEAGMKRWNTLRTVVASVLSVAALLGLFGCDIEEIFAGSGNIQAVRELAQGFELTGLLDLHVESSNGYVVVQSNQAQGVSVRAVLQSRGHTLEQAQERVEAIALTMTQTGNRVTLRYRATDQTDDVRKSSGVSFEVTVPAQADVTVTTSNGAITVRGVEGAFVLDTSNGAIDLSDVIGSVRADTSNGRIDAQRVIGVLDLETSNGAVDIRECEARVDARTSNGRIDFSGVLAGDSHRLRTSNGAITVRVPVTDAIAFDASTSIGSISTNLPLTGDTSGRDWNALLNPPAVKRLELRTSNGNIRIEGI